MILNETSMFVPKKYTGLAHKIFNVSQKEQFKMGMRTKMNNILETFCT